MTACSSDDPVVVVEENSPPTVTFAFEKLVVDADTPVQLNVVVDDADGDPVAVNWTIQRGGTDSGTILGGQGTPILDWRSPVVLGTDSITITATDGQGGSTTIIETIRNGTVRVSAPTTFTKAASPYIIRPTNVTFPVLATTTVEPGVEIFMDKQGTIISVEGTLSAVGTPGDTITITTNLRDQVPGKWAGIQVQGVMGNEANLVLDYCLVEYGIDQIQASFYSVINIQHSLLRFSMFSAVKVTGGSSAPATMTLLDSDLRDNNQRAVNIETPASYPGTITIRRNKFTFNGDQTPRNAGVPIHGAIHMTVNDPSNLGAFVISNNNIFRNLNIGIYLEGAVFPTITNNVLVGNDFLSGAGFSRNIRLQPPFGGTPVADITATNNYWAVTTIGDIRQTVVDKWDSGQITTEVLVDPWRTSCPNMNFPFDEDVCQ